MNEYVIEVWGALACFTRPEFKVERVSYECITPSAVRAIFEAIYWSPEMRWEVQTIEVLNPIAFTHVQRTEVATLANNRKSEIIASENRTLRSSMLLRDVHYRLTAELVTLYGDERKHNAIFTRRATKGQCLLSFDPQTCGKKGDFALS